MVSVAWSSEETDEEDYSGFFGKLRGISMIVME